MKQVLYPADGQAFIVSIGSPLAQMVFINSCSTLVLQICSHVLFAQSQTKEVSIDN